MITYREDQVPREQIYGKDICPKEALIMASKLIPHPTIPNGLPKKPHKHPPTPKPGICPKLNRTGGPGSLPSTNDPATNTGPGILLSAARPPPRTPLPYLLSRPLFSPLTLSLTTSPAAAPRHQPPHRHGRPRLPAIIPRSAPPTLPNQHLRLQQQSQQQRDFLRRPRQWILAEAAGLGSVKAVRRVEIGVVGREIVEGWRRGRADGRFVVRLLASSSKWG